MTTTAPTTDTGPGRIPTALSALSIRSKLAVAVAIGFLLTFGVCFALLSKNLNSMSLEEQAADQADFAAMLSNQMRGPMQFKDGARLADIYATATESDESLIAVEILHGSGEQLAVYNARNAPPALLPQALKESLETKTVTQILSGEIDIVAVPVFAKDGVTVLGVAGFAWDNGIFLAAQNTKILQILGLSAVVAVAGLDLSRFRAAPVAHLSDLSFEGQGAFPAQCRVPSTRIVEAVDVFEDGHLSIATCAPGSLPQQFRLDGLEEGFNGSVVVTIPGPAH